VRWGDGTATQLGAELARLDARRALLLTTRSLVQPAGELARAAGDAIVAVDAGLTAHVQEADMLAVAERARTLEVDALVTVGGGSVIDGGKAVAAALAETGRRPAHIALPTTLSGAELAHYYGVTERGASRTLKRSFADPAVVPDVVVYDPALTLHTPDALWCSSGIKAIDHAVEGLLSPGERPHGDVVALAGIRALAPGLPAGRDPHHRPSRLACQISAWRCYPAPADIQLGLSHRIGHVLGGTYGVPHGLTSGITLPVVMDALAERRAGTLGLIAGALDPAGDDDPARAGDRLRALVAAVDLPGRLSEVGIPAEALPAIARQIEAESPDQVAAVLAGRDGDPLLDLLRKAH
jgi:maleylacetate reductase